MREEELEQSMRALRKSVERLERRFDSWLKIIWYGMLQGAGAVLGAAIIVLIAAVILQALGLTEWSEAIRLYGRYGTL